MSARLEPPRRFDPAAWSATLLGAARGGAGFVFRHGIERAAALAGVACRPHELWLDAGCGTGELGRAMAASGARLIELDADERMLLFARDRRTAGLPAAAPRRIVARAEALPLASESVDGVVAVSLVGCLTAAESFFREAARVLRPGGTAVISFTNRASLLRLLDRRDLAVAHRRPFRLFRVGEAERGLAAAGLRPTGLCLYNFFAVLGSRLVPPLGLALAWERRCRGGRGLGRALARNFLVVARKDGSPEPSGVAGDSRARARSGITCAGEQP